MNHLPVIDTYIESVENIWAAKGRHYQVITIASPDFSGLPGQFVMIQKQEGGFAWSYPYMILENTPGGLKVIATPMASLWNITAGAQIALWGANGRACPLTGCETFVAEPATFHLILPLIKHTTAPRLIIVGDPHELPAQLLPENTLFTTADSEVFHILETVDTPVYMALNIATMEAIIPQNNLQQPPAFVNRLFLFVSTQIGCGIGACKSCYLHSPDMAMGIPVCCNGPYLPYTSIDFQKDRKCFQVFI